MQSLNDFHNSVTDTLNNKLANKLNNNEKTIMQWQTENANF